MKTAQRYLLLFGEFSPTDQWKDAAFTLDWGGGTQDRFLIFEEAAAIGRRWKDASMQTA